MTRIGMAAQFFDEGAGDGHKLTASSARSGKKTYLCLRMQIVDGDGELECDHEFWMTAEDAIRLAGAINDTQEFQQR